MIEVETSAALSPSDRGGGKPASLSRGSPVQPRAFLDELLHLGGAKANGFPQLHGWQVRATTATRVIEYPTDGNIQPSSDRFWREQLFRHSASRLPQPRWVPDVSVQYFDSTTGGRRFDKSFEIGNRIANAASQLPEAWTVFPTSPASKRLNTDAKVRSGIPFVAQPDVHGRLFSLGWCQHVKILPQMMPTCRCEILSEKRRKVRFSANCLIQKERGKFSS